MASIAVALTIGPGELERQAEYLVRSIREEMPNAEVYCLTCRDEQLSSDLQSKFPTDAIWLESTVPIPEYPISAKIEALRLANDETSAETVVLLDTDMLVCNPLEVDFEGDIAAKPCDVTQYWTRPESHFEWEQLVRQSEFVHSLGSSVETTVDKTRSKYPYYNAGVVWMKQGTDFPSRWLELTEEVVGNIDGDVFNADQVALGMLQKSDSKQTSGYEISALNERQNYPLPWRVSVPRDTQVVHYHDLYRLARVYQPWLRSQLRNVGVFSDSELNGGLQNLKKHVHDMARMAYVRTGAQEFYRQTHSAD